MKKASLILVATIFTLVLVVKGTQLVVASQATPIFLEETGSIHYPAGSHQTLSYTVRSYNNGVSWQAFTNDSKGLPHVAGNAENVYPGLIDQIQGINRLIAWNATHGPVDVKSPEARELLIEAGYTPKVLR